MIEQYILTESEVGEMGLRKVHELALEQELEHAGALITSLSALTCVLVLTIYISVFGCFNLTQKLIIK